MPGRLESELASEFEFSSFGGDGTEDGLGREFKTEALKRKDMYDPKAVQAPNEDESE